MNQNAPPQAPRAARAAGGGGGYEVGTVAGVNLGVRASKEFLSIIALKNNKV
jgi:hypothetical protein